MGGVALAATQALQTHGPLPCPAQDQGADTLMLGSSKARRDVPVAGANLADSDEMQVRRGATRGQAQGGGWRCGTLCRDGIEV